MLFTEALTEPGSTHAYTKTALYSVHVWTTSDELQSR
jgi:hypothetical protein